MSDERDRGRGPAGDRPVSGRAALPRLLWALGAVSVALLVVIFVRWTLGTRHAAERAAVTPPAGPPGHVGRQACAECHPNETQAFEGSHHDLAMQPATEATVLGDFSGATLEHFGVKSTFFRRDGKFMVTTDGPDGKLADFEVAYTFGVYPLQQYLVAFPAGAYQALAPCWDARPKEQGGGRWFHVHPDEEIPAGDVLHWTGPAMNWNYSCAECHSTNLRKGWDPKAHRWDTSWSEIDVSCEACHGPGSAHVAWARATPRDDASPAKGLVADLRKSPGSWVMDPATGIAHRDKPLASRAEVETCARCHSRRSVLFEDWLPGRPLLQTHRPSLLEPREYHADGQQLEEVYEYGSFLQSRMYANGVTCTDCHDPHGLRRIADPDAVCGRCHLPARFAAPEHHHHQPGSKGASCVECHAPAKLYMVVDARRDHSFRVPRPDLTEKIGVPNACTGCHADRPAAWASQAVREWYPEGRHATPHYGEALDAGRRAAPGAELGLARLVADTTQPGIVRAAAVGLLQQYLSAASLPALQAAAGDPDADVRLAAAGALIVLPPELRVRLGAGLLRDPVRGVRVEAAGALASDGARLDPDQFRAFGAAIDEYRAAQATSAERPESWLNLGALEARLGDPAAAQRDYEEAIRIGPWLPAPWVNLADLLREQGKDADGERVLREGLRKAADAADLHQALGLLLARQQRMDEALDELKTAAGLDPDDADRAYVYGVALNSAGHAREAIEVLSSALRSRPGDRNLLVALATMCRDAGRLDDARGFARRLVEASPGDPAARELLQSLDAR